MGQPKQASRLSVTPDKLYARSLASGFFVWKQPISRRLITILIVGQVLIDMAIAVNFWIGSVWQSKVTDLLLNQGLL